MTPTRFPFDFDVGEALLPVDGLAALERLQ